MSLEPRLRSEHVPAKSAGPLAPPPECLVEVGKHLEVLRRVCAFTTFFLFAILSSLLFGSTAARSVVGALALLVMGVAFLLHVARDRALYAVPEGIVVRFLLRDPQPGARRGLVPWERLEGVQVKQIAPFLPLPPGWLTWFCFLRVRGESGRERRIRFVATRATAAAIEARIRRERRARGVPRASDPPETDDRHAARDPRDPGVPPVDLGARLLRLHDPGGYAWRVLLVGLQAATVVACLPAAFQQLGGSTIVKVMALVWCLACLVTTVLGGGYRVLFVSARGVFLRRVPWGAPEPQRAPAIPWRDVRGATRWHGAVCKLYVQGRSHAVLFVADDDAVACINAVVQSHARSAAEPETRRLEDRASA